MRQYALEEKVTSEEIRQCRKRLGLTQEDFARFANVSKKTVERWVQQVAGNRADRDADQYFKGPSSD